MHWQNDITLHLVWFLCRSKAGTGGKMPTAWSICSTFCETNMNLFLLIKVNQV